MKKRLLCILLSVCLLSGCAGSADAGGSETTLPEESSLQENTVFLTSAEDPAVTPEIPYVSRFHSETRITLSDSGVTFDGDGVSLSNDIIYYQDLDTYESGYPYGNGSDSDKHSAEEADAHTVINITEPGAYRVTGTLSAGQIRVDLGEDAYSDPEAVVELILDNVQLTCTVAPAILFRNVYECDGDWSTETAVSQVDTTDAGAKIVLAEGSVNTVTGSHVAKIYKDKEGEKKRWKQDGAVYSYMSLNVYGPGRLDIFADNEGLDTELHLTICGGSLNIYSEDDGINTNEDGVSVTTIEAGTLHIIAGLGKEGDGIDSNGYLVINGGVVISSANPASDAGLDSDLGSYINGGVVLALGSTMDWAESDSNQVTMNLQFASMQDGNNAIVVTDTEGHILFAYDANADEVLGTRIRNYSGAVLSTPLLKQGSTCHVYTGGTITGQDVGGLYTPTTISGYEGGTQMMYTGTDVGMGGPGFGGMGGMGGMGRMDPPDGEIPSMPDGEMPSMQDGEIPSMPDGEMPSMPEGEMPSMPDGEIPSMPDGEAPQRPGGEGDKLPQGDFPVTGGQESQSSTDFYMNDKVNAFSGVQPANP